MPYIAGWIESSLGYIQPGPASSQQMRAVQDENEFDRSVVFQSCASSVL